MVKCFDSPFGSYFVPELQLVVDMITRYLAVINSSTNFTIYCVAGKQFRRVLAILVHPRSWRSVHNLAEVKIPHQKDSKLPLTPIRVLTFAKQKFWAHESVTLPLCISSQLHEC